jgi:hypothetical protein
MLQTIDDSQVTETRRLAQFQCLSVDNPTLFAHILFCTGQSKPIYPQCQFLVQKGRTVHNILFRNTSISLPSRANLCGHNSCISSVRTSDLDL